MRQPFKILMEVDARYKAAREICTGAMRYAATRQDWELRIVGLHPDNDVIGLDPDWKPDGIISAEQTVDRIRHVYSAETARGIVLLSTPLVPPSDGIPRLLADDRAIGRCAADYFLKRGYRNFAFVPSLHAAHWSESRHSSFRARLADVGLSCQLLPATARKNGGWDTVVTDLKSWLNSLPKPCALFAACDSRAQHVLAACRSAGISVPESIAVLGVDNDEYICQASVPSLSSIEPDFIAGGYAAARRLDGLLRKRSSTKRRPTVNCLRYGILQLVERTSTSDTNGIARIVTLAREKIRIRSSDPQFSVTSLAASLNCSIRHLENCFKKSAGTLPADEIRAKRLESVVQALTSSDLSIGLVARRCGFSCDSHLKTLFRKHFGQTMKDYRRQHNRTNPGRQG